MRRGALLAAAVMVLALPPWWQARTTGPVAVPASVAHAPPEDAAPAASSAAGWDGLGFAALSQQAMLPVQPEFIRTVSTRASADSDAGEDAELVAAGRQAGEASTAAARTAPAGEKAESAGKTGSSAKKGGASGKKSESSAKKAEPGKTESSGKKAGSPEKTAESSGNKAGSSGKSAADKGEKVAKAAESAAAAKAADDPAPASSKPIEPRLAQLGKEDPPDDVRHVAHWATHTRNHGKRAFVILDKKNAKLYFFDPQARLKGSTPVLLGAAVGDHTVPGVGDKPLSQVKPEEKTTPAGRFIAERGINHKREEVIWIDYDAAVSIHRLRAVGKERRAERLASPTVEDNRISYGCVNVPPAFFDKLLRPAARAHGIIAYVLPEVWGLEKTFGSFDVFDPVQLARFEKARAEAEAKLAASKPAAKGKKATSSGAKGSNTAKSDAGKKGGKPVNAGKAGKAGKQTASSSAKAGA